MSINLFKRRTVSEMALSLANYFPSGRLFSSRNLPEKNLYDFITGLSEELRRSNELLRAYNDQYYPDGTTDFLSEWESALGIPDQCFDVEGQTISERRSHIILKLAGLNVQTSTDFEEVALLLGFSVEVVGGKDASVSPVITPDKTARFTIVVKYTPATGFDYAFDFPFGVDDLTLIECIFDKIRPANCQVLFQAI